MYPGQMVAQPGQLTNQYWNQAGNTQAPDLMGLATVYGNLVGTVGQMGVNPQDIQLPNQFGPSALNFANPFAAGTPNVTAPQGPSGLASSYLVSPQQVQAAMVNAPGSVNPITGVPNVSAPQLNQYQMGPAQQVSPMNLSQFQMNAAGNVAPSGLASTQSWTAPGVAGQYMSPYTQQVVNAQLAQAQTQEQQQLAMQSGQAAQAGAFGGSRQAVEAANTSIGYQQLASQLEAQGLQNAYQAGTQQFNQEQALGQQAQQFNIGTGLQAQLANQQAQQQANVQNLSALLQTQGLQAQTGLQSQLANQQAGLTVGAQNLGANLQTQALGAQTGLQAALANQQMSYQSQLANQQAQEFGLGQQMQASLANQQAGLSAQQLNQQAGLQAGLAAQQMGLQGAQFNAANQMQAAMANQAAQMQALGMQYQGGLTGALQTQNLGMQGQQLGLQSAIQQYGLQQAQQQNNLAMTNQMGQLAGGMANTELQQFGAGLQGLGAVGAAATSQQGYQQQLADAAYQQWMQQFTLPMQAIGWQAGLTSMQPLPYTMNNVYSSTGTQMPAQASGITQALQAALGGLGAIGGIFGFSDVRMKEDIQPVGGLAGIPLYSYRFKGLPGRQIGPMAQEVYQKWPDVVLPGNDSQPWMIDMPRFMSRLHAEAHGLATVPASPRAPRSGLALVA